MLVLVLVLGARCPVLVRSAWPASQAIETRFEGRGSIAFGQMEWYTAGILQARRQASEMGGFRFEMRSLTIGLWAVGCGLWDRRALKESRASAGPVQRVGDNGRGLQNPGQSPDATATATAGSMMEVGLGWFRDGDDAVGGREMVMWCTLMR